MRGEINMLLKIIFKLRLKFMYTVKNMRLHAQLTCHHFSIAKYSDEFIKKNTFKIFNVTFNVNLHAHL